MLQNWNLEFYILEFPDLNLYFSKKINHEQKHHLNQSGNRT